MGKGESWGCEVGLQNQGHLSIMAPKRGKGGDSGLGAAAYVLFPTHVTFSPKDSLPTPCPCMPSGRGRGLASCLRHKPSYSGSASAPCLLHDPKAQLVSGEGAASP